MACGCVDNSCACVLTAGSNIGISGAGTPDNPFIITSSSETTFSATNTDGGIDITPGGTAGHTPVFNLVLDPDSPAALSVSLDGLSVACCNVSDNAGPLTITDDGHILDDTNYSVVLVDTSATSIEVMLPASPSTGQKVVIKDYGNAGSGNASANNITVNPGGSNIDGVNTSDVLTVDKISRTYAWDGTTGWAVVAAYL